MFSLTDALRQVHFPDSLEDAQKARDRLSFDELFVLQLASLYRREQWQKNVKGHPFLVAPHKQQLTSFITSLPFTLTQAQERQ